MQHAMGQAGLMYQLRIVFLVLYPLKHEDRAISEIENDLRADLTGLEATGRWRVDHVRCLEG